MGLHFLSEVEQSCKSLWSRDRGWEIGSGHVKTNISIMDGGFNPYKSKVRLGWVIVSGDGEGPQGAEGELLRLNLQPMKSNVATGSSPQLQVADDDVMMKDDGRDKDVGMEVDYAEGWASRHILNKQFDDIKTLKDLIYKLGVTMTGVRVLVAEWKAWSTNEMVQLWTALQMDNYDGGTACDVKYMDWMDCRNIIIDPIGASETWNALTTGIWFLVLTHQHVRCPDNPYDLDEEGLAKYEMNLPSLSDQVHLWPPIPHVYTTANE
ncbi:hypothetical protein J3A83DRAFT_4196264 [Scleroderma citrinum]